MGPRIGRAQRLRSRARGFALAAFWIVPACTSPPPTALIVRVDSNIPPMTVLRDFEITAQRDQAATSFYDNTFTFRNGMPTLPATLAVIPHDVTDRRTVAVTVTGHLVDGSQVVQRARVAIAYGHVSLLDMYLAHECDAQFESHCEAMNQTCDVGPRCVAIDRSMLPDYPLDGGSSALDAADGPNDDVFVPVDAVDASMTPDGAVDSGGADVDGGSDAPIDAPPCGSSSFACPAGSMCCPDGTCAPTGSTCTPTSPCPGCRPPNICCPSGSCSPRGIPC